MLCYIIRYLKFFWLKYWYVQLEEWPILKYCFSLFTLIHRLVLSLEFWKIKWSLTCIEILVIQVEFFLGPRLNAQSIGCYNRPCLNGGTCHQDTPYDTYRCSCLEDYSGMSCEIFTGWEHIYLHTITPPVIINI